MTANIAAAGAGAGAGAVITRSVYNNSVIALSRSHGWHRWARDHPTTVTVGHDIARIRRAFWRGVVGDS